jgi:hypothetical protein
VVETQLLQGFGVVGARRRGSAAAAAAVVIRMSCSINMAF